MLAGFEICAHEIACPNQVLVYVELCKSLASTTQKGRLVHLVVVGYEEEAHGTKPITALRSDIHSGLGLN